MKHINIEIKARCREQESIRKILRSEHAECKGTDHQTDTYFRVGHGRLKLREGNIENNLIHYRRDDKEGPRQSDVQLFRSDPGSSLKEILTKALGILVVVKKKREIWFIGNVKFHLDQVEGLGMFVEIEAIGQDGVTGSDSLLRQCRHYLRLFRIADKDLVPVSYSDMLMEKRRD
jgi:predicted adenylyl cyclase CyaB